MVIILLLLYLIFGRAIAWSLSVTLALFMGRQSFSVWTISTLIVVGMFEDILFVRPLGGSSLVLVCLALSLWFVERTYKSTIIWWSFGLGIVGELLLHLTKQQPIGWMALVGQVLSLTIIWGIKHRFEKPEGIYVGQ